MLTNSLNFLSKLKDNNYREWFAENKLEYEVAKTEFEQFIAQLILRIKEFDNSIGALEPKDCIFRIFRDVRFSKNKDPYKTNFGAYMAKGGRKGGFSGYYFHLEPSESFISGGVYMAPTIVMKRIREDIDLYSKEFLAIVQKKSFSTTFQSLGDEKLKRVPTGFPADSKVSEYLKLKNITPLATLNNKDVLSSSLLEKTVGVFRELSPLVSFLNRSIEGVEEH